MTNKHLNDTGIQQYALQKEKCDADIIEHIRYCESCRIKAEQYKFLFEEVKQQEKPAFGFNVSELVLPQLIRPQPKYSLTMFALFLLSFAGVIFFCFVLYQFRDTIVYILSGSFASIIFTISLAAIAVIIFQSIELYKKYKRRIDALNFY